MALTADILVTPPPVMAAVTPPQPRPVITPSGERDGAGNPRRESGKKDNGPLSFRAALGETTLAGVGRSATQTPLTAWDGEGRDRVGREARLPGGGPVELSGDEANDLFERAVANNLRKSQAPAFVAATSLYTTSYFAGSSFHTRPGETLEITA
ncbi:MAG: hypothetical protein AB7H70_16610 [Rhodospirillaceae bacterium]